jgi:hypothetical protein
VGGIAIPLAQVSSSGLKLAGGVATVLGAWTAEWGLLSAMSSGNVTASTGPRNGGKALTDDEKTFYRDEARDIWQQVTERRAIWDGMDVHHRIPLEWWHLFFGSPNRLSNLVGVPTEIHWQVTAEWNAWRNALNGRIPSTEEILQQVSNIEKQYGSRFVGLPFE